MERGHDIGIRPGWREVLEFDVQIIQDMNLHSSSSHGAKPIDLFSFGNNGTLLSKSIGWATVTPRVGAVPSCPTG